MKFSPKISIIILFAISMAAVSCFDIFGESDFLDSNIECSDFCDEYGTGYFNYTTVDFDGDHGDCMSLCNTCNNPGESVASTAVCICNWHDEKRGDNGETWNEYSNGNYKNFGKCVNFYKGQLSD